MVAFVHTKETYKDGYYCEEEGGGGIRFKLWALMNWKFWKKEIIKTINTSAHLANYNVGSIIFSSFI